MKIRISGLALLGVVALTACDFNIANTNAPTAEALEGRTALARAATGIFSQANTDIAGQIQQWGIYGREGYNLQGNDPRATGEEISGPQDPVGRAGGQWGGKYQAIRSINAYLAAVEASVDLTDAEKAASRGFANTFAGWHFYRLALRSGPLGMPIDVNHPIDADPAPFVSESEAYAYAVSLLESAKADLQAGGNAFPFTFGPGYTGFTTPATFLQVNRALAAKVNVDYALIAACGAPCFNAALAALSESFITTTNLPASLTLGAYLAYSSAAGEPANPITETLQATRYYVHPSIPALVQQQPSGEDDLRYQNKVFDLGTSGIRTLNGLSSTLKPIMYNIPTSMAPDRDADIPLIKNEELILLRAEANLGLGNIQLALDDINLIRINSGGLAASTLTAASPVSDIVTELLYNRLMSLLWEQGTRWVDARKYGRLSQLPIDRPGDVVHPYMLVPAGECDARNLTVPCSPLGN
jgi:starch-binding outer membrane protein, SusD/RagB family